MTIVAISGGFDPLHPGHIKHIEEALHLGNYLKVIMSRDDQLIEKNRLQGNPKNRRPIPYEVRKAVVEWGLRGRGEVLMNVDTDITSQASLWAHQPIHVFAKGGDTWDQRSLPERFICDLLGIEIRFGVGGFDKTYHSSKM